MTTQELALIRQNGFSVAMAMTDAAFTSAQESNIIALQPDIDAMNRIACAIGEATVKKPLEPTVFFTRYAGPGYTRWGKWDEKWPISLQHARKARFFSATALHLREGGPTGTTMEVIDYAKGIGAAAIAEMTIADWEKPLAVPFASALLFGRRPVDIPDRAPLFGRIASDADDALGDGPRRQLMLAAFKRADPPYEEPFIIQRRPVLPS